MIIEITDLPSGKSIKHINIDISFDDITNINITNNQNKTKDTINTKPIHENNQSEIPDEMKDIEFWCLNL